MQIFLRRQKLVGRVGLDEQTIRRNLFESFALAQFALVQKIAGKTEIRAELGERRNHFRRAAETVQHEAARRARMVAQQFVQPSPRLQTMDAHRQIAFGGELQLREKNFFLSGVSQIRFPAVQADFADGARNVVKKFLQIFQPVRRALVTDTTDDSRSLAARFYFPAPARATCGQSLSHAPLTTMRATPAFSHAASSSLCRPAKRSSCK